MNRKVAIFGCGWAGKHHARAFIENGARKMRTSLSVVEAAYESMRTEEWVTVEL